MAVGAVVVDTSRVLVDDTSGVGVGVGVGVVILTTKNTENVLRETLSGILK